MNGRMVGVFYLAATIAGIISISLTQSTMDASDYLVQVSAHETRMLIGAFFELVMAVAVAGIAISVYPILTKHNASIAVGYVAARVVESVIFIIDVITLLTILTLSQEFVKAGAPEASYFQTSGELLKAARDWGGHVALDVAVFPVGALMFYGVLYQARLVPRWLSGWGLIGAILYLAAGLFVMFDLVEPLSGIQIGLSAPLGLQEIALALWLIVKGFNATATPLKSEPVPMPRDAMLREGAS